MKPEVFDNTREEVREIAESLSLFRSAMHRIAEREAARPMPELRSERRPVRMLLHPALLAPVLATAIFVASLPVYQYFHHAHASAVPAVAASGASASVASTRAADAALMTQIDAEISEDVPDALQPMADFGMSESTQLSSSATEKNHVTQE
jgi:hypothetical protein